MVQQQALSFRVSCFGSRHLQLAGITLREGINLQSHPNIDLDVPLREDNQILTVNDLIRELNCALTDTDDLTSRGISTKIICQGSAVDTSEELQALHSRLGGGVQVTIHAMFHTSQPSDTDAYTISDNIDVAHGDSNNRPRQRRPANDTIRRGLYTESPTLDESITPLLFIAFSGVALYLIRYEVENDTEFTLRDFILQVVQIILWVLWSVGATVSVYRTVRSGILGSNRLLRR